MITRVDIEERVRQWGLGENAVEKDYVIGWVLWGIGREGRLTEGWAFKGGTCIKKCFLDTYRFSEDLDFTVLPGGPILPVDLEPLLKRVLERVGEECGVDFQRQPLRLMKHPQFDFTEGRIYYVGPRQTPQVASIKLDLSGAERVVRPTEARSIVHAFPDTLPAPATVRCYSFEELFAEKIRALGDRCRPRDLYDVVQLYRHGMLSASPDVIRQTLTEKCEVKGLPVPGFETVTAPARMAELKADWANMLEHQLPGLPPVEDFLLALGEFFSWLEGKGGVGEVK